MPTSALIRRQQMSDVSYRVGVVIARLRHGCGVLLGKSVTDPGQHQV